jgi:hypothetical protein
MTDSARVSAWGEIGAERGKQRARVPPGVFIGSSNTPHHAAEQGGIDSSEEKRATASCYPPCEEEDEDELPRVDISSKG